MRSVRPVSRPPWPAIAAPVSRRRFPGQTQTKTPWMQIDDIFFEARGYTWALLHQLQAMEIDFASVLEDKNAVVSLEQITRELRNTQNTIWSPLILNGTGFGPMANHSLVMASYISRVNAAITDLRGDFCQQTYRLACLFARLRCRDSGHIVRLCTRCRSLKANQNPAPFGMFVSGNRLS
jgi:hypothetical protein